MKKKVKLIDQETVAIEPFFTGNHQSKITKVDQVYYSQQSPIELLNEACIAHASTLKGREQAVMHIFNYYKSPIMVAPYDLGFFPTCSSKNLNCAWISPFPFQIHELEVKGKSKLVFFNSISITVDASAYTLKQQHQRLHTILNCFRSMYDSKK